MAEDREARDVIEMLVDELKLQAWLARAEWRNPSMHDPTTREEVDALARLRDEFRVQLHLGKMEATDAWHRAEEDWRELKRRAEEQAEDLGEGLKAVLQRIRGRYEELTG